MSEPRNKAPSAAKRHATLLGALSTAEGLKQLLNFAIGTKRVQINMRTVKLRIFECDGAGQGRDRILVQDSRCRIGIDRKGTAGDDPQILCPRLTPRYKCLNEMQQWLASTPDGVSQSRPRLGRAPLIP